MFDIFEMFDQKFITNSIIISIVGIFLLFLMFRGFLKYSSNFKVVFLSLIVYSFIYITGVTLYYIYENQYIFDNQTKYYIYGRVQLVDEDNYLIRVYSTRSTLESGGTGVVIAKLTRNTVYTAHVNGEEVKIELSDIKPGANVEIMCKEALENNNRVTAIKVTRRSI